MPSALHTDFAHVFCGFSAAETPKRGPHQGRIGGATGTATFGSKTQRVFLHDSRCSFLIDARAGG